MNVTNCGPVNADVPDINGKYNNDDVISNGNDNGIKDGLVGDNDFSMNGKTGYDNDSITFISNGLDGYINQHRTMMLV